MSQFQYILLSIVMHVSYCRPNLVYTAVFNVAFHAFLSLVDSLKENDA